MTSTPAKKSVEALRKTIAHLEAVELTFKWVAEMMARLPALKAAIKTGAVEGCSPSHDVESIEAAVSKLGYFHPDEVKFYAEKGWPTIAAKLASLKTELAALEAAEGVCTLPECAECDARPSPPSWDAPVPYRFKHESKRPAPPSFPLGFID